MAIRDVGKPGAHGRDGVIDGCGVEFLSAGGTNQAFIARPSGGLPINSACVAPFVHNRPPLVG